MSQLDLNQIQEEISQLIKKAEKVADSCGGEFTVDLGYPENANRKMGGTYYGKGYKTDPESAHYLGYAGEYSDNNIKVDEMEDLDEWESEEYWDIDEVTLSEGVWNTWTSSSEFC